MLPSEYVDWLGQGFLHTQGVLLQEITRHRPYVSEELVRTAFVHGLIAALPLNADRVNVEEPAVWNGQACWFDGEHGSPRSGRSIQHDVVISPIDGDAGAACEVKWMKSQKARAVAMDLWKLALSRSAEAENSSMRTFLLIGGERGRLTETTSYLRRYGRLTVNWSRQGGQQPGLPRKTTAALAGFVGTTVGRESLSELLSWGKHCRTPSTCRASLILKTRYSWQLKVGDHSWALALVELHGRGAPAGVIDWAGIKDTIARNC